MTYEKCRVTQHEWTPSSAAFKAADFWGLHDLLLVGYAAPFVPDNSSARVSAHRLVGMLPTIHPYAPCRAAFRDFLRAAPMPGAIEAVRELVTNLGCENVFIVSKFNWN